MAAVFRQLDNNIAAIHMNGEASVEVARINVNTGDAVSALMPDSWIRRLSASMALLIPLTVPDDRVTVDFIGLLMLAADSTGARNAALVPSVDGVTGELVITLIPGAPDNIVLLAVRRISDSESLILTPLTGGSTGGVDSQTLARISALESDKAAKSYVDNAVSGKANTADLKAVATSGSYADLINKPSLFSGSYADLSNKPSLFSGSYADLSNKPALFDGTYASLTGKPTIPAYGVASNGGLSYTANADATTGGKFAVDGTVPQMSSSVGASNYAASETRVPAIGSDGKFSLVDVATTADLSAVASGINYKEAVVKTLAAKPAVLSDLSGLFEGDRFLVNTGAASVDNGVYVVPTPKAVPVLRADDFDATYHVRGAYVFDTATGDSYLCNNAEGQDVPGSNALTFVKYSKATVYTNGAGISLTGSSFAAKFATSGSPAANGTASNGSQDTVARADHIHPTDTTRAPVDAPTFTGEAKTSAVSDTSVDTAIATVKYVKDKAASVAYTLPTADISTLGGVKVGDGLVMGTGADAGKLSAKVRTVNSAQPDAAGNITLSIPAAYNLPTASSSTLGGVKAASSIVDANGVITIAYDFSGEYAAKVPVATTAAPVKMFSFRTPRAIKLSANGSTTGGVTTLTGHYFYADVASALVAGTALTVVVRKKTDTAETVYMNVAFAKDALQGVVTVASTAPAVTTSGSDSYWTIPADSLIRVYATSVLNGDVFANVYFTFAGAVA